MQRDRVGQFVAATFRELGGVEPQSMSRTAFVEKGFFAGFQFRSGDLRAVWFAETGILKFYGANGKLTRKTKVDEKTKGAA
jgi:hypothetical protein